MSVDLEPREIRVNDVAPFIKDIPTDKQGKMIKKLIGISEKLVNSVNSRMKTERDSLREKVEFTLKGSQEQIDDFLKNTNGDLDAFKKRYEGLYTDIVRRVLFKMENRLFAAELFEQATLDLVVEKLYRVENNLSVGDKPSDEDMKGYIEDCAKKHQAFMQKHHDIFAKKHKEQENVEPVQKKENKEPESGEGSEGSSDNTEDGGATNKEDGGPTK